jgi:hypothetical protein
MLGSSWLIQYDFIPHTQFSEVVPHDSTAAMTCFQHNKQVNVLRLHLLLYSIPLYMSRYLKIDKTIKFYNKKVNIVFITFAQHV